VYPDRYRLPQLTAHVLSLLEHRREGFETWNDEAEAKLTEVAREALAEAGRQFAEVADDKTYWSKLEQTVLTAVLPRYFRLAKEEHQLEQDKFHLWRGGDLISRVVYGSSGLIAAVIVWRTAIPNYLEPLPLAFFVLGPLLPDLQVWFAKRKYTKKVGAIIEAMAEEAELREQYRPLMEGLPSPVDQAITGAPESSSSKTRIKKD
jgi:hypothetical protein